VDRASFERLLRRHDALQRDFDTLLACLGRAQTPSASCIQFHANKFKAVCSRSPPGLIRAKLPNALPVKPLRLVQQLCGGRKEILALREVSRSSMTCADSILAGCKLYVCGGRSASDAIVPRSMECLHLEVQTWEAMKPPPGEPCGSAGAVFGQDFYVCGGYGTFSGVLARRFRFAEQKWEVLAKMSMHRFAPAAAVVGGRLYVCGGEDVGLELVHSSAEWFDASAPNPRGRPGVWRLLPTAMSVGRRYFAAAAVGVGDREELLVCGGTASANCQDTDGAVVLDSAEAVAFPRQEGPRPRHLPPMAGPRCCHAAARLRGRVFVCGGESRHGQGGVATVERFDPESESWSSCTPMLRGRMLAAAAVLAGRLYVLGGCQRFQAEAVPEGECSVESFDPATESWEAPSWELPRGRFDFCAAAAWGGELAK